VGDMQIMKVDLKTKRTNYLQLSEKGTIAEMSLKGENDLIFGFSSPVKSIQFKYYNYQTENIELMPFAHKVYDANNWLASHVLQVPSRDGKLIPVSIVYRKGLHIKIITVY
jgi:protease II